MSGTYILTYEVWPYSAPVDEHAIYKKACGDRVRTKEFKASDFNDAYSQARLFLAGVATNPFVWQCPIKALEFVR